MASFLVTVKCEVTKMLVCEGEDLTEEEARKNPWEYVVTEDEIDQHDWEVVKVEPND